MAKRPRDISFSPSDDDTASETTVMSTEPDDTRETKFVAFDGQTSSKVTNVIHCSLPPHSKSIGFTNLEDFETHYTKEHANRCVDCGKNLPSEHFLSLHLDEIHNPLREALAAKGEKTYACFLPECDKKCSSPQKRRLHLIDKHSFPKVYNFHVISKGIDHASSLLQEGRRRRISVNNEVPQSYSARATNAQKKVQEDLTQAQNTLRTAKPIIPAKSPTDEQDATKGHDAISAPSPAPSAAPDIDAISSSMAALRFVPRTVAINRDKSQI